MAAIEKGLEAMAEKLIEKGADVNATDNKVYSSALSFCPFLLCPTVPSPSLSRADGRKGEGWGRDGSVG